jgi:hypothetical protein
MYIKAEEAAKQCNITVEKLEKIARNKRCLVGIKNDDGLYDPSVVQKMLERRRMVAEKNKKYYHQNKSTSSKPRRDKPVTKQSTRKRHTETPEEYKKRFWTEDDHWQDFMFKSINKENYKEWVEYFIGEALAFGYDTAYPHTVVKEDRS